jgi:hypothetical protein
MREIKFRAWDIHDKKMNCVTHLSFKEKDCIVLEREDSCSSCVYPEGETYQDDFILMQN